MTAKPIAYVMEQTLGSITHYENLRRQEATSPINLPRWVPIDFVRGKLPWTITGSLRTRSVLSELIEEIDGAFIHTTTIAPLSVDLFRKKPIILSSDATPLAKRNMRLAYGMAPESSVAQRAKQLLYQQVFKRAAGFVTWSNWAKESFVHDYACREQDVAVIPPGIDLDLFSEGNRDHELPRILFVGGDFVRKGGDLLLKVFRDRFRGRAELFLVTKTELPEEPGVRVFRNVDANSEALLGLYRSSDVFALPTRADCYSLVCLEALAAGMPIVATLVGGIPDVISDGETGHLIQVDDAAALTNHLEALVADPARRREMGAKARVRAEARFDSRVTARQLFEFVRSRC
jgi:glycosyltransferase involved in cell wall biosynthesis